MRGIDNINKNIGAKSKLNGIINIFLRLCCILHKLAGIVAGVFGKVDKRAYRLFFLCMGATVFSAFIFLFYSAFSYDGAFRLIAIEREIMRTYLASFLLSFGAFAFFAVLYEDDRRRGE